MRRAWAAVCLSLVVCACAVAESAPDRDEHGSDDVLEAEGDDESLPSSVAAPEQRGPAQIERRCPVAMTAPRSIAAADVDQRGSLRVMAADGHMGELVLQEATFDTQVSGTVAHTVVSQVFHNPFGHPIEAIYVFPLPSGAAVDGFWVIVDDRTIHGVMKRREEAQRTYAEAKAAGLAVAMLEQERPNVFTQSLANIPPGASIEVQLSVVSQVAKDDGRYTLVLPTVVGPATSMRVSTTRTGSLRPWSPAAVAASACASRSSSTPVCRSSA